MDQKLAEPNPKTERILKTTTQIYKIQQIWNNLPKKNFDNEKDPNVKVQLKGDLYTEIARIYEEKEGKPIKRHVIRRCVNSLINKAK